MAQPFVGEIRMMSFVYAPTGWAPCNGQLLPINQNQPLFSLLGTTYGGNGQTTFALPDLRGRVPIHAGPRNILGMTGGAQAHTISIAELPTHTHVMYGSSAGADAVTPSDNVVARSSQRYGPPTQLTSLDPSSSGSIGGSQAHENMQPSLTVSFCIALQGIFPSQF